jgi:hypothetical protein
MNEDLFMHRVRALLDDSADQLATEPIIDALARGMTARRVAILNGDPTDQEQIDTIVMETAIVFALGIACAGTRSFVPLSEFLLSLRADA